MAQMYAAAAPTTLLQASGLEFEQILKDKLAQLGCDIYDGAFFDEVRDFCSERLIDSSVLFEPIDQELALIAA